jgi:hypothetical protein
MRAYSKRIKKLLREYAAEAYERELRRELGKLELSFAEWRQNAIDSFELSDRLHEFETNIARELYKQYTYGDMDLLVAGALLTGILSRERIPGEVLEALSDLLGFLQATNRPDELPVTE